MMRDARQVELDVISTELKALMEQHVDEASKKVDDLRARAETRRKAIEQLERIQELDDLLDRTGGRAAPRVLHRHPREACPHRDCVAC
jgi:hypothetical protein